MQESIEQLLRQLLCGINARETPNGMSDVMDETRKPEGPPL